MHKILESESSISESEEGTDPIDLKTKEWNDFLVGKKFDDEGEWKIVEVQYNWKVGNYAWDVEQDDDENKMLLYEVLDESKNETWYRKSFDEVIKTMNFEKS